MRETSVLGRRLAGRERSRALVTIVIKSEDKGAWGVMFRARFGVGLVVVGELPPETVFM